MCERCVNDAGTIGSYTAEHCRRSRTTQRVPDREPRTKGPEAFVIHRSSFVIPLQQAEQTYDQTDATLLPAAALARSRRGADARDADRGRVPGQAAALRQHGRALRVLDRAGLLGCAGGRSTGMG